MPRPSAAQYCLGSFTVVAATVALLAVSDASGVLEVVVLEGFALALGTVVTVLSLAVSGRSAARAGTTSPAPAGHEYARQR
ncbi:hypothetical protein [Kitasatospora sp. NPDC058478]|uniref:hypothetical protein n=1 Tax=unclassified Kitasatospora TaxID=2633591 RepID=UPI0036563C5B